MAKTEPSAVIQSGNIGGKLRASKRPVTTALKSPIVTGNFIIFSYINSDATHPATQTKTINNLQNVIDQKDKEKHITDMENELKNSINPKKVAAEIPPTSYVLETDAPYLTPHPYRGKENHSKFLFYKKSTLSAKEKYPMSLNPFIFLTKTHFQKTNVVNFNLFLTTVTPFCVILNSLKLPKTMLNSVKEFFEIYDIWKQISLQFAGIF